MKRYFLSGLILLLPITITILLFVFLVDFLTAPFKGMIDATIDLFSARYTEVIEYKDLVEFFSRILVLAALFFFTIALGYFGQRLLFRTFFRFMNYVFLKLPFVRTIYKVTTEITNQVFKLENTAKLFRKTVVTRFPHEKALALAFEVGYLPKEAGEKLDTPLEELETVFVPTSPHPICGFVMFVNKNASKEIPLSIEEVFKVLVSCGLYEPKPTETDE